jgi:uncharacterized protein (DUF983 family)
MRDVLCRVCGLRYGEANKAAAAVKPHEWGTCPRCGSGMLQYVEHLGRDAGRDQRPTA